jgi:hypothetical protein
MATLAFLVGLPIVVVTAWYHGDRGQRRVSATELVIIALLPLRPTSSSGSSVTSVV